MIIESNKSLSAYNSFGFNVRAEYFISVGSVGELDEAVQWSKQKQLDTLVLGGGSNYVLTRNIAGLVIHINIKGFDASPNQQTISVRAGAGEHWHSLVERTLKHNYYGLENLALIPGLAGAAPIQNIGAYGVEVADRLDNVEVYDTRSAETLTISRDDCEFAYRHSLFKTSAGSNYIVTAINLTLLAADQPNLSYQALQNAITAKGISEPGATDVFNEVCALRRSKLPDPAVLGNAGSFFKNPVIDRHQLDTLIATHPDIPYYPETSGRFKVPAAWLIDQAGWKGRRFAEVGVHKAQALVLVNYGGGNGQQIAILADNISQDILQRYGVQLEREPVLY